MESILNVKCINIFVEDIKVVTRDKFGNLLGKIEHCKYMILLLGLESIYIRTCLKRFHFFNDLAHI